MRKIRAFSLVELMIAIALGGLVIAAVGRIYLSNSQSNRIQMALARLQENSRFANYILGRQIRMSGYQGCSNITKVDILNLTQNNVYIGNGEALQGYEGNSNNFSPTLPPQLVGKPEANNDVIAVKMGAERKIVITGNMTNPSDSIQIINQQSYSPGTIMLITNCKVGNYFIAGGNSNSNIVTHSSPPNTSNELSYNYTVDAQLMPYLYFAYYVKDTGRVNSTNQAILSLYRLDISGNEVELVEGVERMNIIYGVDTNNDASVDTFQRASEVGAANNWGNVIGVKVDLLLATTEDVLAKSQVYKFNGTTFNPSDRKLRRESNIYIAIRNRGL